MRVNGILIYIVKVPDRLIQRISTILLSSSTNNQLPPSLAAFSFTAPKEDRLCQSGRRHLIPTPTVSASKEGVVHNRSFFVILTTDSFEALFISYFKPAGIR